MPQLLKRFRPKTSLYQCLHEHYGLQIDFADEVAEASLASPEEARLLRIKKKRRCSALRAPLICAAASQLNLCGLFTGETAASSEPALAPVEFAEKKKAN